MELEVIRHKTAELFFKGFFPEEVAASYSYQLQRMFESGAAREGDYFVVTKDKKPYLNVEIFRNNTRRIWEKPPSFALGVVPENKNEIISALQPVFDFLDDSVYYFRPEDRLEIVISDEWKEFEIVREMILSHGYTKFGEFEEFELKIPDDVAEYKTSLNFEPFTELKPEERFDLVYENDVVTEIFEHISPVKLYQDYIEEGYNSETLWRFFRKDGNLDGFIMPVFTSGLKNEIKLLNYSPGSGGESAAEDIILETMRLAALNEVQILSFLIGSTDSYLKNILLSRGAVRKATYERYAGE